MRDGANGGEGGGLRRVLCVEDDPDIRGLVELALRTVAGLEVYGCASGAEALEQAPRLRPDVVLLDVMMPEMDGIETFRRLQASSATADVPVIFMTARVQQGEVERYRTLGARGVIAKPFDPMTLGDEIRRICDGVPG